MAELTWHYPHNVNVARMLLQQPGVAPHGGGTALLKRNLEHIAGLIDLGALALSGVTIETDTILLGATTTYAEVVHALSQTQPDHILCRSLAHAASTPLRNRITVAGSVAAFPSWSDLVGPLLALDTTVHLAGNDVIDVPLETYLTDANVRKQALITGLRFPNRHWKSAYHRWTRTEVDYPAFTLTVLLDTDGDMIREARVVAVGTRSRFSRLSALEAALTETKLSSLPQVNVAELETIEIPSRRHGSGDYLSRMAMVALARLLTRLAGGDA